MLIIISVSYKSKALLDANYALVKALNPDTAFRWIVVQNTPEESLAEDILFDDPRFEVIRGAVLTPCEAKSHWFRSIHHAKALNIAINYVGEAFALTLDPDCFILMPEWIQKVTSHMKREKLIFFGISYPIAGEFNYHDFPFISCMCIHLRLMQQQEYFALDFRPDIDGREEKFERYIRVMKNFYYMSDFLDFFSPSKRPPSIGWIDFFEVVKGWFRVRVPRMSLQVPDTGYKIYKKYVNILKHEECTQYALDMRGPKKRAFEKFLPKKFRSFDPERVHREPSPFFFSLRGDQYFWRGELFAFHINQTSERGENIEEVLKAIDQYKAQWELEPCSV